MGGIKVVQKIADNKKSSGHLLSSSREEHHHTLKNFLGDLIRENKDELKDLGKEIAKKEIAHMVSDKFDDDTLNTVASVIYIP